MSKWAGKYVIGLTGNIATGKSVVRKMLEHLGAYGIDADALAHRASAKGAPGYQPVVDLFGRWVVGPDGEINRARLGKIVFSDPEALAQLEKIIHPLVSQAVDVLVRRSNHSVIVIEAIKLLEASLGQHCDSIWVTYAPAETQLARLMKNRSMSEAEARRRITAQPPQEEKIARATIVVQNAGTFEQTWKQVQAGWLKLVPQGNAPTEVPVQKVSIPQGEMTVSRGRPKQAAQIADLMNRLAPGEKTCTADDIMAAFGEKAFLLLEIGHTLSGLLGWQVENLVARTTEILLTPTVPVEQALPVMITEMERASVALQSEASLVFAPPALAKMTTVWRGMGYEQREAKSLTVQAWQEAAAESMPAGTVLFFKQLRQDRVLRPI